MLAGAERVVLERCGTRRTYVHVRIVNTETFMMGLRIGWDMSQPRAQPSELGVFTTIAPLAIMGLSLKKHRGGFQPVDAVFFMVMCGGASVKRRKYVPYPKRFDGCRHVQIRDAFHSPTPPEGGAAALPREGPHAPAGATGFHRRRAGARAMPVR